MDLPLQITFHNMPPSDAVEANIRKKAARLRSFYRMITSCRVLVEAPHRHHHKGKLYRVRIDLTVVGGELMVDRQPGPDSTHEDVYVAIRDTFDAVKRKLQDYARRRRGSVKLHESHQQARVSKLFPESGFGFLETPDGREIYFHKNSVVNEDFNHLRVGARVRFIEEQGEKGPQATAVIP
jgi:cold shock CspA family protein